MHTLLCPWGSFIFVFLFLILISLHAGPKQEVMLTRLIAILFSPLTGNQGSPDLERKSYSYELFVRVALLTFQNPSTTVIVLHGFPEPRRMHRQRDLPSAFL